MTNRRSPKKRAADILAKEVLRLETRAKKSRGKAEHDEAEATEARAILARLTAAMLPGMEPLEEKLQDPSEPVPSPYTTNAVTVRIGEQAQDSPTCPECKQELPWHYEGCTVLAATKKETA